MRMALVVAIQVVVVALLALAVPQALDAVAVCFTRAPARALAAEIERTAAARAELAAVMAAVAGEEAPLPRTSGGTAVRVDRDSSGKAAAIRWPQDWPADLRGGLEAWLSRGTVDEMPGWCTMQHEGQVYGVGAAPRPDDAGWIVVAADDTQALSTRVVDLAGAPSFSVAPSSASEAAADALSVWKVLGGSLESSIPIPGLVGEPARITFSVDTPRLALYLRAFAVILGASVLLISGVQALTFAGTYVQVMQPSKAVHQALGDYVSTGQWNPPSMRFREPEAAVTAITRAVEAQKQAEAEAQARIGQLRAFLDALPAAAAIKDADLRLQMVNSALAHMAGLPPEELIGKTDAEIYPDHLARMYLYHDRQVLQGGETLQFEETLETGEGTRRTYRAVKAPIFDCRGEVSGLVSLAVDITREREMQSRLLEAQQAQLMGRLAGGVAHIFNNVLTAVIGSTELALLSLNEEHPSREDLLQVKDAAERGAGVSRQLLYLGRRQRSADGPANVAKVTDGLLPMLQEMGGPGVAIETRIGEDLPEALIDSGELRQVILHLALNSIEAMTDGGRVLIESRATTAPSEAVMVEPGLNDRPVVLIRVQDTGPGICDEARDHLFEPFYTTKGTAGGRGLGLSVVQSIVRNHQGAVLFSSQPGNGAVFDVYLPSRASAEEKPCQSATEADAAAPGGGVILLAEDEPSVRELTERMLVSQGYTLWTAGRGDEALRLVEARGMAPDLVLTDVLMPGMNGVELALALRARYPEVPVLLMSGYVGESDDGDLKGFPLLWKPFTLESLTQSVRGLLDREERPNPLPAG